MSRAAGTLITTNNATYIPPRFMPGYRGYCPTIKYDYGETYGNETANYFQDYRSSVLNSSADPYAKGGSFPTVYSHNPDLVISNRTRTQDRWLLAPKYQLSNVDHNRKEEIYQFNRLANAHREHYTDKTGTAKPVDFFSIPTTGEQQFKKTFTLFTKIYDNTFYVAKEKWKAGGKFNKKLSHQGNFMGAIRWVTTIKETDCLPLRTKVKLSANTIPLYRLHRGTE